MRKTVTFLMVFLIILPQALALPAVWHADAAGGEAPELTAAAFVLLDADSGTVLLERNARERRAPASTTKILSVLLFAEYAQENDALSREITAVAADFADITRDSKSAGILPGEILTFEQLLYCAFLYSANEACNILARAVSGSAEAFMDVMNRRLEEIGCADSYFETPHGLPNDNHYTTAYDLALILREALQNELFAKLAQTTEYSIPPTNLTEHTRNYKAGNRLLEGQTEPPIPAYERALGGKTGYTKAAGRCLAEAASDGETTLISVVLGCEEVNLHFFETISLLDWGFDSFGYHTLGGTEKAAAVFAPENDAALPVRYDGVLRLLLPLSILPDIQEEYRLTDGLGDTVSARTGDVVGQCDFLWRGITLGSLALTAYADIPESAYYAEFTAPFASLLALEPDREQLLRLTDITERYQEPPKRAVPMALRLWSLWLALPAAAGFWLLRRKKLRIVRWQIPLIAAMFLITMNVITFSWPSGETESPVLAIEAEMSREAPCVLSIPADIIPEGEAYLTDDNAKPLALVYDETGGCYTVRIERQGCYLLFIDN